MTGFHGYIIGAAIAVLVAGGPVRAQEKTPEDDMQQRTEKALREGMETIMRALEGMIKTIPQYEMPRIEENGDIIIRRKRPAEEKKPPDGDRRT